MRVVYVSRMPPATCGIAEYTSMLVNELVKLPGLEVFALGGDVGEPPLGSMYKEPYSGIDVVNCFAQGDVSLLGKCLEQFGSVDLVHVQHEIGIFPDAVALSSFMDNLRERGVKVALTLHTVIHTLGGEGLMNVQKLLVDSSDVVIVHSVLQEQELIRQGFEAEKVHRIPHGTLINPYLDTPRSKLMNELPLPQSFENKRIVTIVGFVRSRDKDYVPVIEAVEKLSRKHDVGLVIAGMPRRKNVEDIALEQRIEALTRGNGLVYFLEGFLERTTLLKLLAVSEAVVIPVVEKRKYPISVSGVFHLAIGSRKPTICTRSHKLVECNLLAPELTLHSFSVNQLVEKLEEVLESSSLVKVALDKLWSYALETRWEKVALKHFELYKEVLSTRA